MNSQEIQEIQEPQRCVVPGTAPGVCGELAVQRSPWNPLRIAAMLSAEAAHPLELPGVATN